ncbi:hypothetical protein RJT34_22805 [Clitoria ternatea]|uniref:Uncharacterized protein n=1 Tax=Clitoria ternatea TaxID=43366 RepID=A0AAN9FTJ4_CLITE
MRKTVMRKWWGSYGGGEKRGSGGGLVVVENDKDGDLRRRRGTREGEGAQCGGGSYGGRDEDGLGEGGRTVVVPRRKAERRSREKEVDDGDNVVVGVICARAQTYANIGGGVVRWRGNTVVMSRVVHGRVRLYAIMRRIGRVADDDNRI